jgi:SAM-dependent methyltransferase
MLFLKRSYTRKQLESWLETLEVRAQAVADIGGRKRPVKDRVKCWQVDRYDILDLPEYDLNQVWELRELYDAAFCPEVFEYVYSPLQAMKNLYALLKPGGVLYASFHFLYPHHGPEGQDYLRYTRWGVSRLLQEAGFASWEIYPRGFRRPRRAAALYRLERMKGLNRNRGPIHYEQGYLVRAVKAVSLRDIGIVADTFVPSSPPGVPGQR